MTYPLGNHYFLNSLTQQYPERGLRPANSPKQCSNHYQSEVSDFVSKRIFDLQSDNFPTELRKNFTKIQKNLTLYPWTIWYRSKKVSQLFVSILNQQKFSLSLVNNIILFDLIMDNPDSLQALKSILFTADFLTHSLVQNLFDLLLGEHDVMLAHFDGFWTSKNVELLQTNRIDMIAYFFIEGIKKMQNLNMDQKRLVYKYLNKLLTKVIHGNLQTKKHLAQHFHKYYRKEINESCLRVTSSSQAKILYPLLLAVLTSDVSGIAIIHEIIKNDIPFLWDGYQPPECSFIDWKKQLQVIFLESKWSENYREDQTFIKWALFVADSPSLFGKILYSKFPIEKILSALYEQNERSDYAIYKTLYLLRTGITICKTVDNLRIESSNFPSLPEDKNPKLIKRLFCESIQIFLSSSPSNLLNSIQGVPVDGRELFLCDLENAEKVFDPLLSNQPQTSDFSGVIEDYAKHLLTVLENEYGLDDQLKVLIKITSLAVAKINNKVFICQNIFLSKVFKALKQETLNKLVYQLWKNGLLIEQLLYFVQDINSEPCSRLINAISRLPSEDVDKLLRILGVS
ncbi:MAG: hypothetical protein VX777_03970 [Chlamydiota bacterium]|nr:hypothetical protein [Chlamydiota bacterium]